MASSFHRIANDTQCWQHEGFGPTVGNGPCAATRRDTFDFTLLFEQSVMSIGPNVLLLLIAPLRWIQLQSQPQKTAIGDVTGWLKVVSLESLRFFVTRNQIHMLI
jgi:hypothetical protein